MAKALVLLIGMNVTIHEAKTHLSKLIQEAIHGEEVLIHKGKQPMVRIVPVEAAYPERRFDGAQGIIRHMSDGFNDELDDFDDV